MSAVISRNPNVMHGAACFAGTRVAVQTLFDHLAAGYSIGEFLAEFPTVDSAQVLGVIDLMRKDVERAALETV